MPLGEFRSTLISMEIILVAIIAVVAIPLFVALALVIGRIVSRLAFPKDDDLRGRTPEPSPWWWGGHGGVS